MDSDTHRRALRAGFTLFEMIIVIAILGLLVALVAPRLTGNLEKSKVTTTKTQIANLSASIEQFYLEVGRYPTSDEGLAALIARPQSVPEEKWNGPYTEKDVLPRDGWDRPFEYDPPSDSNNNRYVIRSLGADGLPGGEKTNADLTNRT
ncbi:MAG: type II secretion system major pseudopilin GspG [Phycisphaeraceae bacterium]|nr:type II secretion system major pseudopilin GspG [Phycisphaeraceae bacterium]MCB9847937.1 type II secretion system major pseudopilin GspG [Phycisphaeraceae bacterium]